jgi:Tfp pilus assembly protein PilN
MNLLISWLVSAALLVITISVIDVAIKQHKKDQEETKLLIDELKKQKENMAYLVHHAEEIAQIEQSQDKVQEEIQNAKSDEEVADIINAIININNARVRDKAEAKC